MLDSAGKPRLRERAQLRSDQLIVVQTANGSSDAATLRSLAPLRSTRARPLRELRSARQATQGPRACPSSRGFARCAGEAGLPLQPCSRGCHSVPPYPPPRFPSRVDFTPAGGTSAAALVGYPLTA